ncbi:MAG: DUF2914 domain-containing protein [Halomonas sp.]|nr:DUF5924 family protein [Halomonas sp.]MDN6296527.1 DUF2914 domain-containing protein [Halomonas sp.]MDN6313880.1 DUF2914 domain-containing protein [Halomonas sp.]MDN6335334.1 DUF2914 domain-containing protein [Halomonas sp.]
MHAFLTPQRIASLQAFAETLVARLKPWSWLWPPIAFGAGLGSFFLVDRQQWLGAALALGLLLAWVLLLSESLIGRFLAKRSYPTLPRGISTFIAQMIHQETLFFTLPFVLATTVWNSGQSLYALLVMSMAVLSIADPLYYGIAGRFRSLYFIFHAHCVFLVVLVTLPIMLHLTTDESLLLALGATLLAAIPSFLHLLKRRSPGRWLAFFAIALLLALGGFMGRIWVPPVSLWMTGSALSPALDIQRRTPQGSIALTPDALQAQGLYVYTAIRAPRGLSETVTHVWHQNGERLDTIELDISGGREQGYRAWSHKTNFPDDPSGDWRVDIMTAGGQRLGLLRFHVDDNPEHATQADSQIRPTGISRLHLRGFIPGQGQDSP